MIEYAMRINTKAEILSSDISDGIAEAFYEHTLADYSKRTTPADYHMAHIALCFGLESRAAKARACERGYIQKMMDIEFTNADVQNKFTRLRQEAYHFLGAG